MLSNSGLTGMQTPHRAWIGSVERKSGAGPGRRAPESWGRSGDVRVRDGAGLPLAVDSGPPSISARCLPSSRALAEHAHPPVLERAPLEQLGGFYPGQAV